MSTEYEVDALTTRSYASTSSCYEWINCIKSKNLIALTFLNKILQLLTLNHLQKSHIYQFL